MVSRACHPPRPTGRTPAWTASPAPTPFSCAHHGRCHSPCGPRTYPPSAAASCRTRGWMGRWARGAGPPGALPPPPATCAHPGPLPDGAPPWPVLLSAHSPSAPTTGPHASACVHILSAALSSPHRWVGPRSSPHYSQRASPQPCRAGSPSHSEAPIVPPLSPNLAQGSALSEWTVTLLNMFSLGTRLQPPCLWPSVPSSPTLPRLRRLPAPQPHSPGSRPAALLTTCPAPQEVHETSSSADPPSSSRLSTPQQKVPSVPAPPRAPEPHTSSLPITQAQGSPLSPASPPRPPWPRAQALPPRFCSLQTDASRTFPRSAASGSRQEHSASR